MAMQVLEDVSLLIGRICGTTAMYADRPLYAAHPLM